MRRGRNSNRANGTNRNRPYVPLVATEEEEREAEDIYRRFMERQALGIEEEGPRYEYFSGDEDDN
jgi:hypothetical protein